MGERSRGTSKRGCDNRNKDARGKKLTYDRRLEIVPYIPTIADLTPFYWARRTMPDDWREFIEPMVPRTGPAAEMWREHQHFRRAELANTL